MLKDEGGGKLGEKLVLRPWVKENIWLEKA